MKCRICGGQLLYNDGFFQCESCQNKVMLDIAFEDVEVYIANIEIDEFERRTKDSSIAQGIYNNLSQKNIKAFSKRFSTSNAVGDDAEVICNVAAKNAPIFLFVATNKTNFEALYEKYSLMLKDKIVIPVYSDMEAYNLPDELKHLQALKYNNLGSDVDLEKTILKLLHREDEISYDKLVNEADKKKRRKHKLIAILCIVILVTSLIAIGLYNYFLSPSRKYDNAQELIEQGKYTDAISILNGIKEYKNSANILKSIYQKYVGYYQDDNSNISMHLSIFENSNALVEFSRVLSNGNIIKVIENVAFENNEIEFSYNDNQNNSGHAHITLQDDGVILESKIEESVTENNIGDFKVFFDLANKSDTPFLEEISNEVLLEWISNRITESQIKAKGYELEYLYPLYNDGNAGVYKIKNTDIELLLWGYDILNDKLSDDSIICAIYAPAKLVIPDKIGEKQQGFNEGDIFYYPGCRFDGVASGLLPSSVDDTDLIKENTIVAITATNLTYTQHLLSDIIINKVIDYVGGGLEIGCVEAINNDHYLISLWKDPGSTSAFLYSVNKTTEVIEFISEVPKEEYSTVLWHDYPDLFDDFFGFEYDGIYNYNF